MNKGAWFQLALCGIAINTAVAYGPKVGMAAFAAWAMAIILIG